MTGAWGERPVVAFDVESTGTDVEADRIVTATVVTILGGAVETERYLIDPGIEIPAEATAIHGITTEYARDHGEVPGPALQDVGSRLCKTWAAGHPVVAMNAAFDLTMLDREMRRYGLGGLDAGTCTPVLDPYVIDKALDPYRKGKRTLGALCETYEVRHDGAHDATEDALAAARVVWRQLQDRRLANLSYAELHERQIAWRREQCASLAGYFRRVGREAEALTVHPEWPLIPARREAAID